MEELMELEHLRALAPPPAEQRIAPARLADRRETLMREIAQPQPPQMPDVVAGSTRKRPRRRRNRFVALILVPAALLGGALAYSMTANRSADQLGDLVTCFQGPSLDAPAAGTSFTGQSLAAFCEAQWNSGSITAPPPGPAPTQWVACEGDQGVDVFPSADDQGLCDRLGLQAVPPDYYSSVERYSAMTTDLWSRFPDTGCMGASDATSTTREVLDAHGYTNWTIQSDEFSDRTPCALAPSIDPVNGVATILGRIRPELSAAVEQGLEETSGCGPQDTLLGDVQQRMQDAGFGDWTVTIDHQLTSKFPCVAGFNSDPATKRIVLTGHSTA